MTDPYTESWFKAALEGSNVVAFMTDETLCFKSVVNPLALGNEEFYLGRRPRDLFMGLSGGPELCEAYDHVIATGEDAKSEILIGSTWFQVVLRPYNHSGGLRGVIGTGTDITRQKIALQEQAHRTKNAFTVAMAIANNTARGMDVPQAYKDKLHARLNALSRAQDAISEGGVSGTTFKALLESQIGHALVEDAGRFDVEIENDCHVEGTLAQYIALAIYELYTNAMKHGALAQENGKIRIQCYRRNKTLFLKWKETGGPIPDAESSSGFGKKLITTIIPAAANGKAEFSLTPAGLIWTFSAPSPSPS